MKLARTFDLLTYGKRYYKQKGVLYYKEGAGESSLTMDSLIGYVNHVSIFLLKLGIRKGEVIINLSIDNLAFNFLDFGITQIGAIHIPITPFIKDNELKHILEETNAKAIFVSHKLLFKKFESAITDEKKELFIILGETHANYITLHEILNMSFESNSKIELGRIQSNILPDDLACIYYTSGSTGNPKGVMVSHNNLTSAFILGSPYFDFNPNFKLISYLPISLPFERYFQYLSIYSGMSVHYKDNNESLKESFNRIKPDVMVSTPIILENLYNELIKDNGQNENSLYRQETLREYFGGRLKKIYCGGASLSKEINEFFWNAGLPVFEMYGITETTGVIALNTEKNYKLGTVGKAIKDIQLKIDSEGELIVKGPTITKGYYRETELTNSKYDINGWFRTGDVVKMDDEGYLSIIGRLKNIYKLKSGAFFNPEDVEKKFITQPFVKNIIIIGENKPFISAIIVPDKDFILEWTRKKGIHFSSNKVLLKNKLVLNEFDELIEEYNNNCSESENIKKYKLIENEFSVEGGELTSTLKVNRNFIIKKYIEVINSFYR